MTGTLLTPESTWYTDGSCKGQQLHWRVVVHHPHTDNIWMKDEERHSNQWDGPWVVWLVTVNEPWSLVIYPDSWVLFET